jgi:hypothetical protein
MRLIGEIDYFRKYFLDYVEHSNYTNLQGEGER